MRALMCAASCTVKRKGGIATHIMLFIQPETETETHYNGSGQH